MKHDQVCNGLEFVSNTDVDLDEIDEIKKEYVSPEDWIITNLNFAKNKSNEFHKDNILGEKIQHFVKRNNVKLKELPNSDPNENFITANENSSSQSITNQIKTKPLCTICKKSFTTKNGLNRHVASVHEGKKPFSCDICDLRFIERRNVQRHILAVHEEQKPYNCSNCVSKFATKSSLKIHQDVVHEGKKTFQCKICGANFTQNSTLKTHMKIHEEKK